MLSFMKSFWIFSFGLIFLLSGCGGSSDESLATDSIQAPVAKKEEYIFNEHGNKRIDNYQWMRLSDEQKNAELPDEQTQDVLDYLNAENDYLKKKMAHTESLQEKLYNEM